MPKLAAVERDSPRRGLWFPPFSAGKFTFGFARCSGGEWQSQGVLWDMFGRWNRMAGNNSNSIVHRDT